MARSGAAASVATMAAGALAQVVEGSSPVMLFFILLGIVVLGGIAVVAAGTGDGLEPAPVDRAPFDLPAAGLMARTDVDRLRFSVGLRGYRMDEVDDVLDRLAGDIEQRDLELEALRSQVGSTAPFSGPAGAPVGAPRGAHSAPAASPIMGAAFTVPETVTPDQQTERTLYVPLEPDGDSSG